MTNGLLGYSEMDVKITEPSFFGVANVKVESSPVVARYWTFKKGFPFQN